MGDKAKDWERWWNEWVIRIRDAPGVAPLPFGPLPPYPCPKADDWPPPKRARPALRSAKRRFHTVPDLEAAVIEDPIQLVLLFTAGELGLLAAEDYWPLPDRAIAWIRRQPTDHAGEDT